MSILNVQEGFYYSYDLAFGSRVTHSFHSAFEEIHSRESGSSTKKATFYTRSTFGKKKGVLGFVYTGYAT